MLRILVVDDDHHTRDLIAFTLRREGFAVTEAADGLAALREVERQAPDLVVLDILMPELDGTEVCRRLRRDNATPIIFLSSKDDEIDRILGLELGGDDYLTKPFSPRELVARIKAVLRRPPLATAAAPAERRIGHGPLLLDLDSVTASWAGQALALTATEFGILRTLVRHPGKVFSRDQLMDAAYPDRRFVSDRTIDSHVRRIRSKLLAAGGDPIETARSLGYRLKTR